MNYLCSMNSSSGFFTGNDSGPGSGFSGYEALADNGVTRLGSVSRYDRRFFVKSLVPTYADIHLYRLQLRKEFKMLLELNHPGVVRVFDLCEIEGVGLCIIMEYVNGVTLREFLASSPSRRERKAVAESLLDAVEYVHSHDVIHGDIKPENIMIMPEGKGVKLIDFGLGDTPDYVFLKMGGGTPEYAAPELIDKGGCVSVATDMYSLGKVLEALKPGYDIRRMAHRMRHSDPERRPASVRLARLSAKRMKRLVSVLGVLCLTVGVVLLAGMNGREQPAEKTASPEALAIGKDTVFVVRPGADTAVSLLPVPEAEERIVEVHDTVKVADLNNLTVPGEKEILLKREKMEKELLKEVNTKLKNARAYMADNSLDEITRRTEVLKLCGESWGLYSNMCNELLKGLPTEMYLKYGFEWAALETWEAWPAYQELNKIAEKLNSPFMP